MTTWKHRLSVLASVWLVLYVTAYLGLSRRGYAESRAWNMCGFYYFTPEDSDSWRLRNFGCVYLFAPLNALDRCLGTGMSLASEPLWGLSRESGTPAPCRIPHRGQVDGCRTRSTPCRPV